MKGAQLRANYPGWFGEFDPDYPRRDDLYDDADGPVVAGAEIAKKMAKITGDPSWLQRAESLNRMIDKAQIEYLKSYADWLPQNAPMGSRWRPYQTQSQNFAGQLDGLDWAEFTGAGWTNAPPWEEVYETEFAKPISANGGRKRKDGIIEAGLGDFPQRRIGTKPLAPVLHIANDWWRKNVGSPFRPNYEECTIVPKHFMGWATSPSKIAWALEVAIDDLNPAARLWQLVCGAVDFLLEDTGDLTPLERNRVFRIAGLVANRHYRDLSRPRK